ncbi:hypothetical protein NECAME_07648 [Necator americanus]|uniref:Uncharacterized protein n=1 Tax=Necator americanus TaxID=51031 RepID=W2TMP4_NECAM|nr:hypothetical protein NECAME_07648 [Necator americanus]ETN82934.1 hypothetical protein NECAME_07648 [Necator americanus]
MNFGGDCLEDAWRGAQKSSMMSHKEEQVFHPYLHALLSSEIGCEEILKKGEGGALPKRDKNS